jgi:FKBP-type peptidyl-prolyl cis-trans isomerase
LLIDNFRTIKWETIHLVIEDILILKNKYLKKKKKKKKKEEEKNKNKKKKKIKKKKKKKKKKKNKKKKATKHDSTNHCLQPLRKIINK